MEDVLEIEGKTIDEAIQKACDTLQVPREKLAIEILSEGSSGLLGILGAKTARIRARILTIDIGPEPPLKEKTPASAPYDEETALKAKTFVEGKVKEAQLPELTKTRIAESLSKAPVVKDGKLDEAAYTAAIDKAIKAEAEYLAKLGVGKVSGVGGSTSGGDMAEAQKELIEAYVAGGMTKERAEALVKEMI